MKGLPILAPLLALLLCPGCDQPAAPAPPPVTDTGEPTHANPKLQTLKLWLGAEEMNAELALTPQQIRTGMMFRTNRLPEDAGMLFPLPYTMRAQFWMKNCPVPLAAAYIDNDGVVEEIHAFEPNNTNTVISATNDIRFVLETSEGWFDRHHVGTGTVVRTERGSLMGTFFGTRP